ncbi:MAG: MCE family protein [Bdellovibrionaceae bacterium]|jgi:phospholipid/cholesterol/gamma-HCH transport system substrate-binding protein|nr:MCE family protein [Pseudobdellovibrionaceae bacterium]
METAKNEVKVGLFVLAGIIILSISVLLLGGDQVFFKNYISLNVKFKETQGLAKGSVVSLSGIVIGNVKRIHFDHSSDSPEISVEIAIEEAYVPLIKADSVASIKTKGALGDKYIFLSTGSTDALPIQENQTIKVSQEGDLLDIISNSGSEVKNVFEIISEIKFLMQSINENNNPKEIMSNIKETTHHLNATVIETKKFVKYLNSNTKTIKKLDSILDKIDNGQGTLGALVNDPVIHRKLVKLLGGNPNTKFLKPLIRKTIESHDKSLKDKR